MNDVFIIALLLVMEDKKWRNIFYLEDIPLNCGVGNEQFYSLFPFINLAVMSAAVPV